MLVEKTKDAKPELSRPALFREIIHNDEQRRITRASPVVSFEAHKRLSQQHKDYMRSAEQYVFGTKEKGTKI
jgi:hypothetical protein